MRNEGKIVLASMVLAVLVLGNMGLVSAHDDDDDEEEDLVGFVCEAEEEEYAPGETVTILCTNTADVPVVIGVGISVATEDGDPVYNPPIPAIALLILPGGTTIDTWDQTFLLPGFGGNGEQVPPGEYLAARTGAIAAASFEIEEDDDDDEQDV